MEIKDDVIMNFEYPKEQQAIIKVVGVGGGGGNAVTHMYREDIRDVSFALCNTDNQALLKSEVPYKVQLGKTVTEGLGAGNKPEIAKKAAEENIEDLKKMFSDETKMVFITAGMGGGTGTGAAPVIAKVAKDMGILTVGIVTIPFEMEGMRKILQALEGVEEISKNVDALLVINNERLIDIYGGLDWISGFKKADDTLATAARSIAEIITIPGHINLDFADVKTTLKDGGVAIMSSGFGEGEDRVSMAIENALNSPLLNNNDVFKAKKILFNVYFSSEHPLLMEKMNDVQDFMAKFGPEIDLIWGNALDESLGEKVKITILATGFGIENIPFSGKTEELQEKINKEEKRKKKEEEEKERARREYLLIKYMPKAIGGDIGKARPKPFIFTLDQMDDNEIIEAVINHPAYNRNPKVMRQVEEKAEAKLSLPDDEDGEIKGEDQSNSEGVIIF